MIKFPTSNEMLLETALQISLGTSTCQRQTQYFLIISSSVERKESIVFFAVT